MTRARRSAWAVLVLWLASVGVAGARGATTVVRVGPNHIVTESGVLGRGIRLEMGGRFISSALVSPGDRLVLSGRTAQVHACMSAGALVDVRDGSVLLGSYHGGLNLALPPDADVRLNGEPCATAALPRGQPAFVRWDGATGRVGRLEVVDGLLPRARPDGPGDLWAVRAGLELGSDGPSRPLRLGDVLQVELRAPSGGRASFDVCGVAWGLPAPEVAPGVYRGRLRVLKGMDLKGTFVLGHFRRDGIAYPVRIGPRVSFAATPPVVDQIGPSAAWSGGPVFATYHSAGTLIDASRCRLWLDGRSVTRKADRTVDAIVYWPTSLHKGLHKVRLEVVDRAGNRTRKTWSFRVSGGI